MTDVSVKAGLQAVPAGTERAPFSLGTLDVRVHIGDIRLILFGFLATLAVALPIGYGTGFLVSPAAQWQQGLERLLSFDALVDIPQIVLFEEILFRALLFGGLYNRLGLGPAVAASACIFGVLHLIQFPYPMAVMATWAGVVFALQYARTRRLSTPMITHALIVAVQFFVLPME